MNTLHMRWPLLLALVALLAIVATSTPLAAQDPPAAEEPAAEAAPAESAEAVVEAEAAAEEPAEPPMGFNTDLGTVSVALDTVWVMVAAFLVMFMQAGFGLVETGLTRAKSAVNICMKNLLDFAFGSLAFWAVGFGLMFSVGNDYFGDSGFFLQEAPIEVEAEDGTKSEISNFDPLSWTKVPLESKFFFQLVFAATAATIVSGAMAERTRFASYMAYSVFISTLIYPISGHWIWGGGWLADRGFWDFAGSTVVHSVGGWLALVGAFVLGPRIGKYDSSGKAKAIPGHNLVYVTLGVFILWLGWFGFNPGSTMAADAVSIAHITVTTNSAAAAGAIAAIFVARAMFGKWEATMALNGALAGLVAITAPCLWVSVPSAIIIGAVGGTLVVLSVVFIDHTLKIDDPVGAISVHGVCGAWGTLAVGLFAFTDGDAAPARGLFTGGDASQLITQAIGVGSVFLWCMVTGAVCFYGIKAIMGLRVSPAEEAEGLDITEHGNEAYHGFQFTSQSP
ncbi:MAG: ammonium transporter [Pirellulales bacterium]